MSGQVAATTGGDVPLVAPLGSSLWGDAWKRLRKNKAAVVGSVVLILMILACYIGPIVIGGFDYNVEKTDADNKFLAPSGDNLFGTDNLGRNYLLRTLAAGQTSLEVGLVATLSSIIIGVFVGAVAGYYGGRLDEVIMRCVDFLYGIPYMFLVILIMLMFEDTAKGSALPVFIALGLVQWLTVARIVRGQVLTLRNQEFVQAAKVLGASDGRIIFRHIIPNVLSVVIVYATLTVPAVILLESFLSFLGLGVELSWGVLVSEGVQAVNPIKSYWWLLFWPSLFLALTLLSLNFMGEGLRDALDPKTRKE